MAKSKKPKNPAVQAANQALAPVLAEIQRQQAEERARAAREQQAAQQRAGGLASVLGEIAPQTQATYKAAGDSTAAYAKGFAVAAAGDSNAAASELNALLAKTGSGTQQVQAAGANGGDVLYGLGGYIPASTLAREGAAFTAAAQHLPATARFQGMFQAGQIGLDSREKLKQLDALLRGEKAKLPGLVQDFEAQMADQRVKDRAQKLNELLAVENLGIKQAQLGVSQYNAQTSRQNANTSAFNAKLRAAQSRFNQGLAGAKLELDQEQLDLAWEKEARLAKGKGKGGFTAKQRQDLSQTAFETAADDFDAGTRPVETLRDLIAAGVPFSLAIKAIQRFGRDKGADAYWKATLGWTKKGKK